MGRIDYELQAIEQWLALAENHTGEERQRLRQLAYQLVQIRNTRPTEIWNFVPPKKPVQLRVIA